MSEAETVDVLIVGAGISGIGAAWHLQHLCPERSWTIVEARDDLGGTWDLFRYPGIRSDSDMYTLGYSFRPWTDAKAIADGPSILRYLRSTAADNGIDDAIRFRRRVRAARFDSGTALWTVDLDALAEDGSVAGSEQLCCRFLHMCTGYYDYETPYTPDFEGVDDFGGQLIHPQHWPEDLEYAGKRVVVIGSGATAVTLVPELAKDAAEVTMLQRSPTYVVARPDEDRIANALRRVLPTRWAYAATRWKNILMGQYFYKRSRSAPQKVKDFLLGELKQRFDEDYVAEHFTPRYDPWDQRMCLVPNGDLFDSLEAGTSQVVTGQIDRFTADGIRLQDGRELAADIVVTATGLNLSFLANVPLTVDGEAVDVTQRHIYKGMMMSGVPNMAWSMGYTNASWTLKCDLTCAYVCRLLNHLRATGQDMATPTTGGEDPGDVPMMDLTSGYVQRAMDRFPKQGETAPWRLFQDYRADVKLLRDGPIDDAIEFSVATGAASEAQDAPTERAA